MEYIETERKFLIECTGRKVYAEFGVLGLCPNTNKVHHGFEGSFVPHSGNLTGPEKREIADYMVKLWKRFGETD